MGCRIGMATDVDRRFQALKNKKKVPKRATCKTVLDGLKYAEASLVEMILKIECGPRCDGSLGGNKVKGRVWSVYRIDWKDKK